MTSNRTFYTSVKTCLLLGLGYLDQYPEATLCQGKAWLCTVSKYCFFPIFVCLKVLFSGLLDLLDDLLVRGLPWDGRLRVQGSQASVSKLHEKGLFHRKP